MLLPRTRLSLALTRNTLWRCARAYSAPSSVSYSPKVRALPFVATPEDVIKRAGPIAAVQTFQTKYFSNVFGAITAYYGLGGEAPRPARIQPVYLPSWIIDAHVSAKVWLSKRGDGDVQQQILDVHFQRSFMPGFSLDPLSRMSFSDLATDERLEAAVPFTEELTKQNGMDVMCLPYTTTPFALAEAARTLSYNDAVVQEDLRFDPTTLRSNLITAYPLLVPVYLLQYDVGPWGDKPGYSFTMIVEAAQQQGSLISENVLPLTSKFFKESVSDSPMFDVPEDLAAEDFVRILPWGSALHEPFAHATFFSNTKPAAAARKDELEEWIDRRARAPGAIESYARFQASLGQAVDFDDLRVRDVAEAQAFAEYLNTEQNVLKVRDMVQQLIRVEDRARSTDAELKVHVLKLGGKTGLEDKSIGGGHTFDSLVKSLEVHLKEAKALRERHKPEWLKEWEARQKGENADEDSREDS